ncbi:MAG: NHL repeat-containing protein [Halanaerobiales bacterium]|nr:NHL repeat-containing protein [Halanaerobiales bacterium]
MRKNIIISFILIIFTFCLPILDTHAANLTYLYSVATDYFEKPYNLTLQSNDFLYVIDKGTVLKRFDDKDIIDFKWKPSEELLNVLKSSNFINLTVDANNLYFTLEERQMVIADTQGQIINTIPLEDLSWIYSIAVDPNTNTIVIADNSKLYRLDKSGNILNKNKYAELWQPCGLAVNSYGLIYVADTNNQMIKIFDQDLELISSIGGENSEFHFKPYGIAIDHKDRIYITNLNTPEIYIFSASNILLDIFVPNKPEEFSTPTGITINGDFLYVADTKNNRVQKYKIDHKTLDLIENGEDPEQENNDETKDK